MSYCTEAQVRSENKKLKNTNDVTTEDIEDRIVAAVNQIKIDLSSMVSETDLDSMGATNKILNRLCINKAVELSLIQHYGVSGKLDERSDVQYFKKEYDKMIKAIKEGDLTLLKDDEELSPKGYPKASGATTKFYNRKGMVGFDGFEESLSTTYVDD